MGAVKVALAQMAIAVDEELDDCTLEQARCGASIIFDLFLECLLCQSINQFSCGAGCGGATGLPAALRGVQVCGAYCMQSNAIKCMQNSVC